MLYLRVSTPSQVNTDYSGEGISIGAQRTACQQKAAALGAEVVFEFVEPGRTATTIDKRPVFQEMMAWLKAEKNAPTTSSSTTSAESSGIASTLSSPRRT